MNQDYYRIAKLCHKEMLIDPSKLTMQTHENIRRILQYNKYPIMSWYLLYLKALSQSLGFEGMEDYVPPSEICGVKMEYALSPRDIENFIPNNVPYEVFGNVYKTDEEKFVTTFKGKYQYGVAYLDSIFFYNLPKAPQTDENQENSSEKQENTLLTKEGE